jgi:hypothetical protein
MPRRRPLLAGLALGALGLSGCNSLRGRPGHIQTKHVEGRYRNETFEDVLAVSRGRDDSEIQYGVADRWEAYVDDPEAPTISESFHEALHREYHEVAYSARFCSEQLDAGSYGCIRDFVEREDFNQAQVTDRVRAAHLDEQDRIEIYSVIGTRTWTDSE